MKAQTTGIDFRPLFRGVTACKKSGAIAVSICLIVTGCATSDARILDSDQSQVQLRAVQSRAFETTDRDLVLRNIIATLQDLGFVIDRADQSLGTVSATKLQGYLLKINVTARSRGSRQTVVRANAEFNRKPVTEPKPYQDFFVSLEKSLFLTAQAVD